MPTGVVESFEKVDIDEDDRERLLGSACPIPLRREIAVERAPVGDSGERIGVRKPFQLGGAETNTIFKLDDQLVALLFNEFAGSDVFNDGDEIVWAAVGLADERYGEVDPDQTAVLGEIALLHRIGRSFSFQE